MGSETRHQRYGTEAWNRSAARNNIDKHLQNPTIKEGKITKAVIASPRSSLSSNVRTLNNADDEESGLHNTYLDYEHSKQMPSQSSQNTYYTSSITGTRLGSNASGASSAGYQAASYASRAAAPPKEEVSKPYTSSYNGYTESPFQALAQGVESSGNQLPHLRAPSNTSRPSAQSSKNSSSLTPHALALSSAASSQASQQSLDIHPPHLRNPPTVSSQHTVKSTAATPAFAGIQLPRPKPLNRRSASEGAVKPSIPMNPGLRDKSAAKDSAFPCSYRNCTKGFSRAKDLKRHKVAEHDWCSVCDVDCEDDVALIEHRIASTLAEEGKHIACLKCGDDFRCEAGRDRHTQLAHREVQDIKCPGCGEKFERAAGLLAHVSSNKCKDRSGLVSQAILSRGRVDAALEMERLAATIRTVQFATENGSVDESVNNRPGGVMVTQSLLDRDDEAIEQEMFGNNENSLDDNLRIGVSANDASDASSNGKEIEAHQNNNWLSVSQSSKGEEKQLGWGNTIEGLEKLSVADSHKTATTQGWTKTLFPDAKPTPATGGWTQPKAQPSALSGDRGFSNHTASPSVIGGRPVCTDWDYFVFERDPLGRLKCPFQRCDFTYVDEAAVKAHLISGYHQGTAQQCVKCLKMFKSPVALLAHMESPSVKCNVRDTQQYGHILYMVSGGFIDVNDDERGTKLPDGQLRMRARTKAELAEQQARLEEEQRERERQIAAQW